MVLCTHYTIFQTTRHLTCPYLPYCYCAYLPYSISRGWHSCLPLYVHTCVPAHDTLKELGFPFDIRRCLVSLWGNRRSRCSRCEVRHTGQCHRVHSAGTAGNTMSMSTAVVLIITALCFIVISFDVSQTT